MSVFLKTALLGLAFASSCWSKTIALWRIDNEPDGTVNSRCLVAADNNLSSSGGATNAQFAATVPNPDLTPDLFDNPTNNVGSARMWNRQLYSSTFGRQVDLTNDFTVEGWYKVVSEPTPSTFQYFVGPRGGGIGGWMLSLRSINSQIQFSLYVRTGASTVLVSDHYFDSVDLTGDREWRHVALTYAHAEANGVWTLFLDGTDIGACTNSAAPATQNTGTFFMGGRGGNYMDGFLDYWRASDTVLTPEEFLNYPLVIPPAPAQPKTLAYWRFDGMSGTPDAKSFVNSGYTMRIYGTAPLATNVQFAGADGIEAFGLEDFEIDLDWPPLVIENLVGIIRVVPENSKS